jgi:hypothetical protein
MADMGQGTWAFRLFHFRGWLPAHSFELLGQNREAAPLGSLRFGTKKATGRDSTRPRSRPRSSIDALSREPVHCSPDVTGAEKVTGRMFARD